MSPTPDQGSIRAALGTRMPALDGLRGLAIILIVWHNTGLVGHRADTLPLKLFSAGANAGWIGVQLFFVLSGFLITGILLDSRGAQGAWKSFIARRSLRIFPLYYAALAFFFILLPAIGQLPSWLAKDHQYQVWYWTYLVNWTAPFRMAGPGLGHFWSLAVEEQFYIIWAVVILWLTPRTATTVAALTMVGALLFRFEARSIFPDPFTATEAAYGFTIARADALTCGALLAIGLRNPQWSVRIIRLAGPTAIGAALITLCFAASQRGFSNMHWPVLIAGPTLTSVLFTALIAWLVFPGKLSLPLATWAASPGLRTLGKYSYAMYIVHLPLGHVAQQLIGPQWETLSSGTLLLTLVGMVSGVFACSFGLALITWRWIEAPALALRPPRRVSPAS